MMFQTWPGCKLGKQLTSGFANILLAIVVGIGGFYFVRAFANWHFSGVMTYPSNIFAMANIMLGLSLPVWVAYSTFFGFWLLPLTLPHPGSE